MDKPTYPVPSTINIASVNNKITARKPVVEGVASNKSSKTHISNNQLNSTATHKKNIGQLTHLISGYNCFTSGTNRLTASNSAVKDIAPDKPDGCVTFLDLARELRQNILMQTYDETGFARHSFNMPGDTDKIPQDKSDFGLSKWFFCDHKDRIQKWSSVLRAVDGDDSFHQNIDYIEIKWMEELEIERLKREVVVEEVWKCDEFYKIIWEMTREGQPPWLKLHGP